MADDTPVTRLELHEELSALRASFEASMAALSDKLIEKIRDMQTELVSVFMDCQRSNEARLRVLDQEDASLKERVSILEQRLREVERKLLLHPPSA